jgi:hypothetical protein
MFVFIFISLAKNNESISKDNEVKFLILGLSHTEQCLK